ncbi:MAG: ribonuclease Z [Magnetococcales bacterium]|nr:ribonuclease Z [Magnetococcales bacterium]
MHGTILGSGTGIPLLNRQAPGYLLEVAGGRWLVDCGSGTLLQLERLQKSFLELDGAFITHTHVDHIGDLMSLIHAFRILGRERQSPFHLFGPAGFADFFARTVVPVVEPPDSFPFHVAEIPPTLSLAGMTVRTQPTIHSDRIASVAYRFEQGGKSIVFSGDCDYDPRLVPFARQADLLLLDCSTLDANKVKGHLSAGLAGFIAAQAEVRRLIPTHFYPIEAADSRRLEECRIHFTGPIELAEDLMPFQV